MRVRAQRRDRDATPADIVVVSCGAINSAALLLRSANDKHPRGLANGSDVVGRHYMGHVNSVLMAISKCPNPTVFQKTLAVNDFYFGSEDWEYPDGPHLLRRQARRRDALAPARRAIAPGLTLDLMAKHSLDFWLTSEDLPDPNNRVTLDRDGNIVLTLHAEQRGRPPAADRQAEAADAAADECADARPRLPPGPVLAQPVRRPAHSAGWRRAPERHDPLRPRPADVGAGS